MPLAAGARVGPYEVVDRIGAGGMGVVYRARDLTLQRDVALKVLPDAFSNDPDRLQRFTREAQTLAALNHPNIAHVHGFEDRGDTRALVMEYVEGEDLAARLLRGPLAIGDAVPIARQLATALAAAHDQGIIHRDLKPANIKVRPDGTVKVLDFGLAKMLDPPDIASGLSTPDVSLSPTITTPTVTRAGVILGTAAYMSPEQAKGLPADKRADIWAFGCVLFEMLSGARPFEADDVSETLAAVLMREPDWSRLPPEIPRSIQTLLQRCLERDRAKRMSNIAGATFALDEMLVATPARSTRAASNRRGFAFSGWIVAVVLAIVGAIVLATRLQTPPATSPTMRVQIGTPSRGNGVAFALSPDGRSIVFSGGVDDVNRLHLRRLESDQDQPLAGTEEASYPFWSPDSRSVAFFARGLLKRIDLASGFVRTLASAPEPRRGDWNREGIILFGASAGPLLKVSAEGGAVVEATSLLPGQSSHRFPQFLPEGRRFLMLALGESNAKGLFLASLDNNGLTRLSDGEPSFALLPSYVLTTREGALWAQRFNADSGTADRELLPVAPRIWTTQVSGSAALSSSSVGSFAFRADAESRQLTWLDRMGREVGLLGEQDPGQPNQLNLSADGRTAAVVRTVNGNRDVWLADTTRGSFRRFTFGPSVEGQAVFSPDNSRIAYASDPKATLWDVYEQRTDGAGGETMLRASPENEYPIDWSPDGRYLLVVRQDVKTDQDILALPLFGDRKPVPLVATPFLESEAKFSPDGRWIAFSSNETGRTEVYVQPFPGPGAKIQASIAGGRTPRWSRGTAELFYIAADNRLMAIPIKTNGSTINAAVPQALLTMRESEEFVPSPDGQRFLVNRVVSDPAAITLVLNWQPSSLR